MPSKAVRVFYKTIAGNSTFEGLFELAKALYKEKGWVCIPFRIEKDLSAKGKKYTKSPVGRWGQLIEGKVSLEEYWKEIENSLPYNQVLTITGIGLITGKTSQITVLDIDDPKTFEETTGFKIQELLKKTLAVRTINGGYHFYFKYDPEIKTGTYQHLGFDIRNDKALAVIPPSFCMEEPPKEIAKAFGVEVEIDGPKYEWLNDLEPIEFPKELKQLLSKPNQIQQKVENQEWKKLSEEQIKVLVDLFVPVWHKGYRDFLTLYLLGLLYKNHIAEESTYELIDRITTVAGDEERKQRLDKVKWQYRKYLPYKDISSIKGWSGITEVLEAQRKAKLISEEGVNFILSQLQEIFKPDKEALKRSKVYVITGFNPKRGYVNDTKNCWIASWRETKENWELKNIYYFSALTNLEIIYDPYKEEKIYVAQFIRERNKEKITFTVEGNLDEIHAYLKSEALAVREDSKQALASIFNEFERKGLAKFQKKATVRGFILNENGELELNKHQLPELNREKVREALEILNYYFEKYAKEKPAEAATVLKWALVAPFNWVKKQAGKKALFKWLFLLGSPDTGKTTDAEIFTRWIWGLEENATSGSTLQTASRIAQKADRWTFSNIVNEASSLFSKNPKSDEIRELLRQIWDGIIAREKRRQNGQRVVELAAATFIFTANETPTLYQGDIKRIEIIKYNPKARVVDKNTFEADFNYEKRAKLAHIGSAVYEWAKKNLDLILEVDDYRMLGELILTHLYEEYFDGQIPEWVNLNTEETELEEDLLPTKEDILAILVKTVNQTLGRFGLDIARGRLPILKRLLMAKNLDPSLPYEVDEQKGKIYIKRGFLQILKEEGFQIATLIDLAQAVEGEYKRVHNERLGLKGNKVVELSLETLERFNGTPVAIYEPEQFETNKKNIDFPEEELDFNLFDDDPPDNKSP